VNVVSQIHPTEVLTFGKSNLIADLYLEMRFGLTGLTERFGWVVGRGCYRYVIMSLLTQQSGLELSANNMCKESGLQS
jgi:hypothetical protein